MGGLRRHIVIGALRGGSGSGWEPKPIGGGPWGPLSIPMQAGVLTHIGEESESWRTASR